MKSPWITVRLDEATERRLCDEAAATGKTESELVLAALDAYFTRTDRPASAFEVARQAGIIGCAKGLPPDLSTNKNHLEGFGR